MPKQPPHHEMPIVPEPEPGSPRLDSRRTVQQPSAAERVWALYAARQVIFSAMRGRDRITALLLSKGTFSEAVKALYRIFFESKLPRLQQATISLVRYFEYIDAVRILHVVLVCPPKIPKNWFKRLLCEFRNLRHVTWSWGKLGWGRIDCPTTDASGIMRMTVYERQTAILIYTLGDGEPRMLGLDVIFPTGIPSQWQVTRCNIIERLPGQLDYSLKFPLVDTWRDNMPDSPEVVRIPWIMLVRCLVLTILPQIPTGLLPRKLQAPLTARGADDMMLQLRELPPAIAELEIGRIDRLDVAGPYPPRGGLGYRDFLQAAANRADNHTLQSLAIPLYHESLFGSTDQSFTSIKQLSDYLKTFRPIIPFRRFGAPFWQGQLRSLRLSIVLPWNIAKLLENCRPDDHATLAVIDELGQLLSPCRTAVRCISRLGPQNCDFHLDVLAPFGEKGDELLATRILSEKVLAAFRAERVMLEMQATNLVRELLKKQANVDAPL